MQLLVTDGVRADGTCRLLAFTRSQGERQTAWEGLLQALYGRGLQGAHRALIVTGGGAGLAATLQGAYPRVPHQRGGVHQLRNLRRAGRRREPVAVKADVPAIRPPGEPTPRAPPGRVCAGGRRRIRSW